MDSEIIASKQRGKPFEKGRSGNPAGRPKGARNRATVAAESLLDGEAEALTRRAIDLALGGDTTALRLCLERLIPPRREREVYIDLPEIKSKEDVLAARNSVLTALSQGLITPSEAVTIVGLIELNIEDQHFNLDNQKSLNIRFV